MTDKKPTSAENLSQYLPQHSPANSARLRPPTESVAVNCKKCGYDLRGLRPDRPCPECGSVNRRDPKTPYLKPTDHEPAYLKRIARGLRMLALSWLLIVPLSFISAAAKIDRTLINSANTLGLALTLFAVYLIADRSNQELPATKESYKIRRFLALALTAAALLSQGFASSASKLVGFVGPGFFPTATILLALAAQTVICLIIAPLGDLMHDEPLARRAISLAWLIPLLAYPGILIASLIFGRNSVTILLPLMLIPLAAYLIQIPFFIGLISLRRQFIWTIRYQKESDERAARLRKPPA